MGDEGGFDELDCEADFEVPLDVACLRGCGQRPGRSDNGKRRGRTVEEPRAGVVRDDAERDVLARGDLHRITAHRVRLALVQRRVQRRVVGRVVRRAPDELHLVPVQVAVQRPPALASRFLQVPTGRQSAGKGRGGKRKKRERGRTRGAFRRRRS